MGKSKKEEFNEFRFSGLEYRSKSNKYYTMNRVSEDENKIVVKVADDHLIKTQYGYALILDYSHVVFLKDWQVSCNYFGNEVLLQREFFNVKERGKHDEFELNEKNLNYDYWLEAAKAQDAVVDENGIKSNRVNWEK